MRVFNLRLLRGLRSRSERIVKKSKKSSAKMAREDGGISFIVLIPLYFIHVGIERTSDNRYRFRTVRKTKVEKLKAVNEDDFFNLTNSHAGGSDNLDYSGTLDKPGRNSGHGKKRGKKRFKRNKVAPAPHVEAWKKAPRVANSCMRQEICYSSKIVIEEEDGKLTLKRSTQKWDTKTGKEIKLDKTDSTDSSSTSVGSDPSSFLNVLTPVTNDNFNLCNPNGSSCDLSRYEDDNVPGPSGVQAGKETVLGLTDDKAWVETKKHEERKSTLSNFLARFKRSGPKTTKVRKLRTA